MHWEEMGPKEKVKDEGSLEDAFVIKALYTRLGEHPFECTIILEGALVMAGMSLLWRELMLHPRSGGMMKVQLLFCLSYVLLTRAGCVENSPRAILLPAVPADPSAYISQPPATPSASVNVSAIGATSVAAEVTSLTHVLKKRKTFGVPTLTAFEAMQAAYAMPLVMYLCITGGVQGQGVTPTSLASAGVTSPAVCGANL
ncbi:hypothetical protein Hanom_Chr15g01382771 [Helianthus anomalus]